MARYLVDVAALATLCGWIIEMHGFLAGADALAGAAGSSLNLDPPPEGEVAAKG